MFWILRFLGNQIILSLDTKLIIKSMGHPPVRWALGPSPSSPPLLISFLFSFGALYYTPLYRCLPTVYRYGLRLPSHLTSRAFHLTSLFGYCQTCLFAPSLHHPLLHRFATPPRASGISTSTLSRFPIPHLCTHIFGFFICCFSQYQNNGKRILREPNAFTKTKRER